MFSCEQVSASWVLELERMNEWMNEEDYEVDEAGKKKVHRVDIVGPYFIAPMYLNKQFLHYWLSITATTVRRRSNGSDRSDY